MSGLVGYDSSSEDDTAVSNGTILRTEPEMSVSEIRVQNEPILPNPINDEPMVGPSIPEGIAQNYVEYEEDNMLNSASSERDMIRYLTQASHPMNEMPSSPPGSPDASSTGRIKHFLSLKSKGVHFNEDLMKKNAFKNPSLLSTLMDRAGITDESAYRISLPSSVFDATSFPAAGYKEALLKSQQTIRAKEDADKKALVAAGRRTVEFTSGGISAASSATSSPSGLQKRRRQ